MKTHTRRLLTLILVLAFALRIHGLDFDQGQHQHPDERFLTIVASTVRLPRSLPEYFSAAKSPLNPYNHEFDFFVYGTFPLFLTRLAGELLGAVSYANIVYIGRLLSMLFDTATVLLIFHLARRVLGKDTPALWSAFIYATAVLPIQQAHFFTVDSFLVFFNTATLLALVTFLQTKTKHVTLALFTGALFGITLANKTSLGITLPLFLLICMFLHAPLNRLKKQPINHIVRGITLTVCFIIAAFMMFRILQPYAFDGLFTISSRFSDNIAEAHRMITGEFDYPPNLQWIGTLPIIHPLLMIFLWGLGPVASLLAIGGIANTVKNRQINKQALFVLFSFGAIVLFYQGVQHAKYMRYFYPLYPLFAVFAGAACMSVISFLRRHLPQKLAFALVIVAVLIWPLAFSSIYTRAHTRVAASRWIYDNIPAGSTLTSEEWDDSLPLMFPDRNLGQYKILPLPMPAIESEEKWNVIRANLTRADYLILSSNRMYGSIPKAASRYPQTTRFYQDLFAEKLGFHKVAEFSSYPGLFGLQINDESAEESFTVYDHPKVIIFKKK